MTKKQPMPYLKLWLTYLDDVRLNRLPEAIQMRYIKLYMLAYKGDSHRLVDVETGEPFSAADLAMLLRTDEASMESYLAALVSAGLLGQAEDRAWTIIRYWDEQVNQAEWRQKETERRARLRQKQSEEKASDQELQEQDQAEGKDFKGKVIISNQKSSQVKRPAPVPRDTHGTDAEPDEPPLPVKVPPELIALSKIWMQHIGERMGLGPHRLIVRALQAGIDLKDIEKKIISTAEYDPDNLEAYFATCMQHLIEDSPGSA